MGAHNSICLSTVHHGWPCGAHVPRSPYQEACIPDDHGVAGYPGGGGRGSTRPRASPGAGGGMEDEDEFATVHHAKPKFKPLPRQACQQDSRLVARVCDLARRGLTLAQIDADLREEGV